MIRPIHAKDRPDWSSLWEGYQAFYEAELSREQSELTWTRLLDPSVPLYGTVYEHDGKIVGFAHALVHLSSFSKNGQVYLEDLFVSPDFRGRSIGRALINAVIAFAHERKLSCVHWVTGSDNPARKLYDSVADLRDYVQYRHVLELSE
ncbi:GNAT family N-acetyltransferase [uncultured Algimonas sp.]|uniref:GNAT family N-acetyltransferase n=1 Tax=uncultured Algimonas sp. TaxID=1547920 RepID=UPI002614AF0F|nr:GNAT family N-acetyltransferase [uncultured Algimonas sp.]